MTKDPFGISIPCDPVHLAFPRVEGIAGNELQCLLGGKELGPSGLQVVKNLPTFRRVERVGRVFHDADAVVAEKKTFGSAEHAVFRNDAEYEEMETALRIGFS